MLRNTILAFILISISVSNVLAQSFEDTPIALLENHTRDIRFREGFPAQGPAYACNYNPKDLHCVGLEGKKEHLEVAVRRGLRIYQTLGACQDSCENLIQAKSQQKVAEIHNLIVKHIPTLYRVLRDSEVLDLGSSTRIRRFDTDVSVFRWINHGSNLSLAQYFSFSAKPDNFFNEKYYSNGGKETVHRGHSGRNFIQIDRA